MAKKLLKGNKAVRAIKKLSKSFAKSIVGIPHVPVKIPGDKANATARAKIAIQLRQHRAVSPRRVVTRAKLERLKAHRATISKGGSIQPATPVKRTVTAPTKTAPAKRGDLASHVRNRGAKVAPLQAVAKTARPSTTPAEHTPIKVKPHVVTTKAAPTTAKAVARPTAAAKAARHPSLPGRNLKVGKGHIPTKYAANRRLMIKDRGAVDTALGKHPKFAWGTYKYSGHRPESARDVGRVLRKASTSKSGGGRAANHIIKDHKDRQIMAAWLKANR